MATIKLRALVGEWEDHEPLFLGAVSHENYEAICEDDATDDQVSDRWEDLKIEWVERGPVGIGETREVDVLLTVPADLFSTPLLTASVQQSEGSNDGSE